jgi:nucleotide-binding universal stress UspA family protein
MAIHNLKSIFTVAVAENNSAGTGPLAAAIALAQRASAFVTVRVMGGVFTPPFSLAPEFISSLAEPMNADVAKNVAAAEAEAIRMLTTSGLAFDVKSAHRSHGELLDIVRFQARLHDLTILSHASDSMGLQRAMLEEALFHCGRPVMVLPAGGDAPRGERIVIGWDGTQAAVRAAHDALPLLRAASHVELVCVVGEKDLKTGAPGAEFAPHLARHGVKVEVVDVKAEGRDAGKAIRERAKLTGADIIVMGGFAHSRLRQLILGSATDSMLRDGNATLFLSH